MATNPSKQNPILNPATKRGSRINDPNFHLQQGYSPFDLSHQEMFTARFGEYTPSMHLDTIPADRFILQQNCKAIHNRIDGNLLSTINQYDETFFVSIQNLIPNAYERFIPNPVKGDDLPNSALPQVPFGYFCANLLYSGVSISMTYNGDTSFVRSHRELMSVLDTDITENMMADSSQATVSYKIGYMSMLAYILSRGQLMDYFGLQLDDGYVDSHSEFNSRFQHIIDNYFTALWELVNSSSFSKAVRVKFYNTDALAVADPSHFSLTSNNVAFSSNSYGLPAIAFAEKSQFRGWLQDCFEAGDFPLILVTDETLHDPFVNAYNELHSMLTGVFSYFIGYDENDDYVMEIPSVANIDAVADPFRVGFINALKPLAYQLIIAQYCTNDHIDNIYTADLYQQNLRSVMFPANNGLSQEPIYTYNGVQFEYDLMTFGAWRRSFLDTSFLGSMARSFVFASLMFVMRRSLRYGDYFATGRPNMLAVGDLYINVEDGKVSPVNVTENLLMQRYLNAANHLGQRVDSLYAAVYGVVPSDRPVCPRYVSHRKTKLMNQITNNTANEQGKQTTNLVAYQSEDDEDNIGVDIFLDDYGVLISIVSYDVLPVYTSGIDRSFHFSDRFDYYNPQLQNIGDQPILQSEMFGEFELSQNVFAYQMRNAEYKYKVSRAHGGLVNDLPGYVFRYPPQSFRNKEISPDFIRDKPQYFDQLAKLMTGDSPANYYHFIVSCQNSVKSARLMQATPPILF